MVPFFSLIFKKKKSKKMVRSRSDLNPIKSEKIPEIKLPPLSSPESESGQVGFF